MPKGNPNGQTIASQKWNAKAGYVAKTYKLKKDVTDAFAETCDRLGVSKACLLYTSSEVIYVKAGLVSDFRHKYGFLKCRNINDFHHANDAYLNIVVGNVYNTKFTKHPINFIKDYKRDPEKYKYHMDKLFEYPVSRGEENAWITKGGESFKMVRKMTVSYTHLVGTIAAIVYPMDDITDFLYLIGSVFAPMIAIQIADFFIIKKDSTEKNVEVANVVIWVIGFVLYRYLMTVDIIVGNTLPDMVITVIICVIVSKFGVKNA